MTGKPLPLPIAFNAVVKSADILRATEFQKKLSLKITEKIKYLNLKKYRPFILSCSPYTRSQNNQSNNNS